MFHLSRILRRARTLFAGDPAVLSGELRLTYAELGARVAALAGGLRAAGLGGGDRVAILDRNSFRYLELNFAAAEADAVLLPLNIRLAPAELVAILGQTDCRLLFASAACSPAAAAIAAALPHVRLIDWDDRDGPGADNEYERLMRRPPSRPPGAPGSRVGPERPTVDGAVAQIFFTSGTTGGPKGVCLTSANLVASAYDSMAMLEMSRRDVWLHAAPMFHLADAFAIWTVTLVGGRHVVSPFEPSGFAATVARERVTKTSLPPVLLDMIARAGASRRDLRSLDRVTYGGSPMLEAVHLRAAEVFPCALLQCYGITETGGMVCQQLPGDYRLEGSDRDRRRRASVGHPAPAIDLKVVDDAGRELPPGEIGELVVSGPRVMAGYWRQPELTAAAMRHGWYHTGDVGRRDHGSHFYLVDRKKDVIISGGENVYSVEVENALTSHQAVLEAAVFGVPSDRWGEEVRAVVVLRDGAAVDPRELVEHCRGRIGGFKVPKTIEISAEPLPKTGPGKIAKAALRAPYWK